jgi:hypothetical protein
MASTMAPMGLNLRAQAAARSQAVQSAMPHAILGAASQNNSPVQRPVDPTPSSMPPQTDWGYAASPTPPTPPPPPPSTGGGVATGTTTPTTTGSSTPPPDSIGTINWDSLIQGDPNYLNYLVNSKANLGDAASSRKAALEALVLQYGGLPSGISDSYGDLSAADLANAAANPFSDEAGIQRNYDQSQRAMLRSLAARGALESGDLGYNAGQLDTSRGTNEYNAGAKFASDYNTAIGSYLNALGTDRADKANAIQAAYGDVSSNPLYQQGAGLGATLDPNWQAKYGTPVYRDASGNLYTTDANGNPVPYTAGSQQ